MWAAGGLAVVVDVILLWEGFVTAAREHTEGAGLERGAIGADFYACPNVVWADKAASSGAEHGCAVLA